jgi:putative glutamine amidotransferase
VPDAAVPEMSGRSRPLVAIPGRFSAASALRFRAVVAAERLAAAVFAAGGEPVIVLPERDASNGERLGWADAVLLPGGGDLAPASYGETQSHDAVYGVDTAQDAFDLAVAIWALGQAIPLFAVCRGLQVVNVALKGTLVQHMDVPHRSRLESVQIVAGSQLRSVLGADEAKVSCFHHQRVATLGRGLVATAYSTDGTVEAVELPGARGYFSAVQWHPEDTYDVDPAQQALFDAFLAAAKH